MGDELLTISQEKPIKNKVEDNKKMELHWK